MARITRQEVVASIILGILMAAVAMAALVVFVAVFSEPIIKGVPS